MQTLIIFILPCIIFCTWGIAASAQNAAEWWRQKKTRIQYLEQQITALEASGIIALYACLLHEIDTAFTDWTFSPWLHPQEKSEIHDELDEQRYHAVRNIDQLLHLTEDGQLKMPDSERLQAIRSIGDDAGASLAFVLWYKEETNCLIKERQQEPGDIDHLIILFP